MAKFFEIGRRKFVWLNGELYIYSVITKDLEWVESCPEARAVDVAKSWLGTF